MSSTLQRPPEATTLVHRHPHARPPVAARLVIAGDDHVVVVRSGEVLGVVAPGAFALHPQQLPFLAPAIVGDAVDVELWFVRTAPFAGLAFGGSLGTIVDPTTRVACATRCFGELAITARDPARLVLACLGQAATDEAPALAFVKQAVVQQLGDGLARLAHDGTSLLAGDLVQRLSASVAPDFASIGLGFAGFGNLVIAFSDESIEALKQAQLAAPKRTLQGATAAAPRCPQCTKPHGGGKFCGECGAPVPV